MSQSCILVIEDEESVQQLVKLYLEKEGFAVISAFDGEEGMEKAQKDTPDLILLDIMLPGMDGRDVCREIRKNMDVSIIMLTAKGDEYDRVLGLEIGADDYISKPFSPREMVARVKAVLRRVVKKDNSRLLEYGNLQINSWSRQVFINNEPAEMPPKEFDLLWFLASNPERAYSREQLLFNIWGYTYLGDPRTVDTHIKRLREKLSQVQCSCHIKTVWGYGYKFEVSEGNNN
ncbi:MAG: response regulator transcription factor [Clostridiales bacterium]|nr:response regulator transcription factor [Clostridiales bacterium]MCF8021788.1 response regulator transcription factor [Clostridiales bacterium]